MQSPEPYPKDLGASGPVGFRCCVFTVLQETLTQVAHHQDKEAWPTSMPGHRTTEPKGELGVACDG